MPWKDVCPMDQRRQFVIDARRFAGSWTELCTRYSISRKTGYKWLARAEAEGLDGLAEHSRRPLTCPHATAPELVAALLEARRRHPSWGPRKLLRILHRGDPGCAWPARSTAADLLRRHGCIESRPRRRRLGHPGRPRTPMTAPNEIWTADFKGQFRTGNGIYCYPLTIADGYSRYLLGCQALLAPTHTLTKPVFERLFREYGLPQIIRTDNGVPFATCALGRLSALSVWWVRLGIFPELIEPAKPQQNGRHERMHRTLKRETARPPAGSHRAQQRRFNAFRLEFNRERPHEALGDDTPASRYQPARRRFPERLPPLEYPNHCEVRLVSANGGIRWQACWVNVSHVLGGEYVGLEEVDDGEWDLYFGPLKLGRFHERLLRVEDALGRLRRRRLLPMSPD
jgi:transposase InsO family protein